MTNIKSFFDKNGYYLAKGIYNSSLLGRMQNDFDRVTQQLLASKENINARWGSQLTRDVESDDSVVLHTHNIHSYSSIWLHALLNPEFLDVAEEILGPDIILHHTKLFLKPPKIGAAFPLHSGKDQVEDGNSHTNSRLVLRGWNHRANRTSASKI